jgi:glutaredoxin
MKLLTLSWLGIGVVLFAFQLIPTNVVAQNATYASEEVTEVLAESTVADSASGMVYMFGRDDCGFCKKQKEFMADEDITYVYLNITTDTAARTLYDQVTEKHGLSKVTPITVVGERVFLGFNSPLTTGKDIKAAIKAAEGSTVKTVEDHIKDAPKQDPSFGGGCSEVGCTEAETSYIFDLPILGVVDLKTFSLFTLSLLPGPIDGFNRFSQYWHRPAVGRK